MKTELRSDPSKFTKFFNHYVMEKVRYFQEKRYVGEDNGAKITMRWTTGGLVPDTIPVEGHGNGQYIRYTPKHLDGNESAHYTLRSIEQAHKEYYRDLGLFALRFNEVRMRMGGIFWEETPAYQDAKFAKAMFQQYKY